MKRRAFFGFLGGAAVAGPGAVKRAAAQTLADLNVGAGSAGLYPPEMVEMVGSFDSDIVGGLSEVMQLRRDLAKLMGKSAEQRQREMRQRFVDRLDPDIAALHSVALGRKMDMQRVRDYERYQERERSWIERRLAELTGLGES